MSTNVNFGQNSRFKIWMDHPARISGSDDPQPSDAYFRS